MKITLAHTTIQLDVVHDDYHHSVTVEHFGHGWIIAKLVAAKDQGWNQMNSYLRAKMRKEIEVQVIEWCNLNLRLEVEKIESQKLLSA